MVKRSPVKILLFSILTAGIYAFYWLYATTREVNPGQDSNWNPQPSSVVLFAILTFGIYWLYWCMKMSLYLIKKYDANLDVALFLLMLGPGSILTPLLIQDELNKHN